MPWDKRSFNCSMAVHVTFFHSVFPAKNTLKGKTEDWLIDCHVSRQTQGARYCVRVVAEAGQSRRPLCDLNYSLSQRLKCWLELMKITVSQPKSPSSPPPPPNTVCGGHLNTDDVSSYSAQRCCVFTLYECLILFDFYFFDKGKWGVTIKR